VTADEVTYTLDNTWEKAERRLSLLEQIYDPGTTGRLTALGVAPGWRCLELGAGHGSITRWLCDRVGPAGSVVAVDLEPRFVEADPRPNLAIHRRDIVAEGIPGEGYDLIHARALIMHLPDRESLLADLARRLRPGGVLLLEEGDFFSFTISESSLYAEMWNRCGTAGAKAGGDWYWARSLPGCLARAGLVDVSAQIEVDLFPGGSPWAELTALSWEQVSPLLVADGCSPETITTALAELTDPDRWFPSVSLVAVSARHP
jgi:SAM-dependent methyltransferase